MDKSKTIGQDWDYFTAGAVILGDILNQTVPDGLEKYADAKLFEPLRITNYKWQYTPDIVPNTAGGFQMNSLDNARYGQLYLDNGVYNEQQLVPVSWIKASLTKQLEIPKMDNEFYGYLLWNKKYNIKNKVYETFYASGNGGNKIMIFNDLDVVIIITATAYGQPYMHHQADEIIEQYLLPSILGK
jgi:CubicO group peptidase (beta-lactamase class C family)